MIKIAEEAPLVFDIQKGSPNDSFKYMASARLFEEDALHVFHLKEYKNMKTGFQFLCHVEGFIQTENDNIPLNEEELYDLIKPLLKKKEFQKCR